MPPDNRREAAILPGPSTRGIEGEEHRRAPRSDEVVGKAWLPWKAYGRARGLKAHRVAADGAVQEIHDPAPKPRRRPKSISSSQWAEGGRSQ